MLEELALNFGGESTPSHDDGRSQTFEDELFFGWNSIRAVCEWHESPTLIVATYNSCAAGAYIGLTNFSSGHL